MISYLDIHTQEIKRGTEYAGLEHLLIRHFR